MSPLSPDVLLPVLIIGFVLSLGFIFYAVASKGFDEHRPKSKRLPDQLQWGCLVHEGVLMNKNGTLQKTIAYRGPDLASASTSELVTSTARLNNALKRLGSGWTVFAEAQRFESNNYPRSEWPNDATWLIDQERRGQFEEEGSHFESSYFLTFVWELPSASNKRLANFFYDDPKKDIENEDFRRDLAGFLQKVGDIAGIMKSVFPEVAELDDDQTLAYLHSTVSTHRHPVHTPDCPAYLDAYIPDQPFTPGDIPLLGEHFMPTVTIAGFPTATTPGILDALNHLQIEYRWVNRFIFFDQTDARSRITRKRQQYYSKRKTLLTMLKEQASNQESALVDNDAVNKATDADAALQELGQQFAAFGQFTSTVTVWHKDIEEARRRIAQVREVIQSRGFTVKDETLNSQEAWLGSIPGETQRNVRRPILNTLNLAHIMPLSAIWAGDPVNLFMREISGVGAPHVVCNTTGDTPFRLNLNVGDVGHASIVGPTGAGKSTLLCLLELQWLKYPRAQVIVFDRGRSVRGATMAVGGQFYEPGSEHAPLAFQPFRHVDQASERVWASQYVVDLLSLHNVELDPHDLADLDRALVALGDAPIEQRTFTGLSDLWQSKDKRAALRPYTLDGNLGQLFDADHDNLHDAAWMAFEMGHVMEMGERAILPTLMYLFHRIEQRFDGSPTLLVLDEAWLFLQHPVFAERLQAWLRTLRKLNVFVVFATQEVAAAAESSIRSTIMTNCPTRIFLPDEEALTPAVADQYAAFGLSDTEIGILARATKKRDYYYRSAKGRRLFSLDMGEVALTFSAMSSPDDQAVLDEIERSTPREQWAAAMLEHKQLSWALDLIRVPQDENRAA